MIQMFRKFKFPRLQIDWLKMAMIISLFFISVVFRFGVPTEPRDRLVFDENYFVLQTESYMMNKYFFDPHGIIGRIPLVIGHTLANPDFASKLDVEKLADKAEDGYQSPLNLDGIRFFPKLIGSLVPVLVFAITFLLVNWRRQTRSDGKLQPITMAGYLIPYLAGLLIAFENSLILDSRIAMLSQPMFFAILFTLYGGLKYYQAVGKRRYFWFAVLVLAVGIALGTKMVAYAAIPLALMLQWLADWRSSRRHKKLFRIIFSTVNSGLILYLAAFIYLGSFVWHFSQLKTYSDSAANIVQSYKDDLKNGTDTTSFLTKYSDWLGRSLEYQALVPELDYAKDDEIGSMWITWPIMARPIRYWTEFSDDTQQTFQGLISVGNPVVWFSGLLGVLVLAGLIFARFLSGRNGITKKHLYLALAFAANWLPFAPIARVMYIYHYYPALIMSVIVFAVLVHDFLLPRLEFGVAKVNMSFVSGRLAALPNLRGVKKWLQNFSGFWKRDTADKVTITVFLVMLALTVIAFYIYAPFTYKLPISKQDFETRMFIKEWNMKWPGKK